MERADERRRRRSGRDVVRPRARDGERPRVPRWHGAASDVFVTHCLKLIEARGLRVGNADITVLAEAPRIAAARSAMQGRIAELLKCDAVNVKATTPERLGALGRAEGLAAYAVVRLESST